MKISQLPKATAVKDADIIPIVQGGETKQVPKSVLVPPEPVTADDLQLVDGILQLTAKGEPLGEGVELPKNAEGVVVADDDGTKHIVEFTISGEHLALHFTKN